MIMGVVECAKLKAKRGRAKTKHCAALDGSAYLILERFTTPRGITLHGTEPLRDTMELVAWEVRES